MKKIIINTLAFIMIMATMWSCYKDEGNYSYNENVNNLNIEVPKKITIKKDDTVFVIRPKISQSILKDSKNLKFKWTVSTKDDQDLGKVTSTGDTLALVIDTKAQEFYYQYFIRFYVTDTVNNLREMHPIEFNIRKPYEPAWMILHKDGATKLGSIEFLEETPLVSYDAYYENQKKQLSGDPVKLGLLSMPVSRGEYTYWNHNAASVLYCFTTNAEESGILMQDKHLTLDGTMQKYIYSFDYAGWNPSKVTNVDSDGAGAVLLSDGKAFQGSQSSPILYALNPNNWLEGECYVEKVASVGNRHILYETKRNRLLTAQTAWNYYEEIHSGNDYKDEMVVLPSNANSPNSPEASSVLSPDKKIIYLGKGYWYGKGATIASWARHSIYAVALSQQKKQLYLYDIHPYAIESYFSDDTDKMSIPAFYTVRLPEGINETTPFASSQEYNLVLFYGSGNKIYKLDFATANADPILIYEHPDASIQAKAMTFAKSGNYSDPNGKPEESPFLQYGHPVTRSIGIAFDTADGKGEFIILNLSNSGNIAPKGKYPSVQTFKGFGKITDIKFI
ncbi:MAG: PKD-like family lipoprotein [Bacteroidia bacterium]|nr:PKD-like family lipoprotein [Bacteroidia bacterium]